MHSASVTWTLLDWRANQKELGLALFSTSERRSSINYHELNKHRCLTVSYLFPEHPHFSPWGCHLLKSSEVITVWYLTRLFLPWPHPHIQTSAKLYLLLCFSPSICNKSPDSINSSSFISLASAPGSPWLFPVPYWGPHFQVLTIPWHGFPNFCMVVSRVRSVVLVGSMTNILVTDAGAQAPFTRWCPHPCHLSASLAVLDDRVINFLKSVFCMPVPPLKKLSSSSYLNNSVLTRYHRILELEGSLEFYLPSFSRYRGTVCLWI